MGTGSGEWLEWSRIWDLHKDRRDVINARRVVEIHEPRYKADVGVSPNPATNCLRVYPREPGGVGGPESARREIQAGYGTETQSLQWSVALTWCASSRGRRNQRTHALSELVNWLSVRSWELSSGKACCDSLGGRTNVSLDHFSLISSRGGAEDLRLRD